MKTRLNTFLVFILLLSTLMINAQDSEYSLQIDHGISKTSHHRIEAPFGGYYVIYIAQEKKEKLAFHLNFSLVRRINRSN